MTSTPAAPKVRDHTCWACHVQSSFVAEPTLLVHALRFLPHLLAAGCVGALALVIEAAVPTAHAAGGTGSSSVSISLLAAVVCLVGTGALALSPLLYARSMWQPSRQLPGLKRNDEGGPDEELQAELGSLLGGALRIPTVSYDKADAETSTDTAHLQALHAYLRQCFPLVFGTLDVNVIAEHSLLLCWEGSDPSLRPVVLMAHLDVVPPGEAEKWGRYDSAQKKWVTTGLDSETCSPPTREAFGGQVDDEGVVWGRGAIDNKHNLMMQLRALEGLLRAESALRPRRTLYLAYGHDEEIGGAGGAKHIAAELVRRGVKAEFILDEGTMIVRGLIPGVDQPIALVGNTEKGAVNVRMSVDTVCPPGHASMPPPETNVGVLATAISRIERRPMPAHPDRFYTMLRFVSSELPLWLRLMVTNTWLFGPILKAAFLRKPKMAASIRTTTAVTVVRAGTKSNVVPGGATAIINHRIHPGDEHMDNVVSYDRRVADDKRVTMTPFGLDGRDNTFIPPAPVSSTESYGWNAIRQSVARVYGAPVCPALMIGNTDTRWFWDVSTDIYRFSPIVLEAEQLDMFHGYNERISTRSLLQQLRFYQNLLRQVVVSPA